MIERTVLVNNYEEHRHQLIQVDEIEFVMCDEASIQIGFKSGGTILLTGNTAKEIYFNIAGMLAPETLKAAKLAGGAK